MSWAVSASITSVILCIWPCFISSLITSTARSDMRLASSWMVIVSGIDHLAGELLLLLGLRGGRSGAACGGGRRRRERVRSSSPPVAVAIVRRPRLRLLARRLRRLRRRDDPGRHAGAADDALALGLVLGAGPGGRARRQSRRCGRTGGGRIGVRTGPDAPCGSGSAAGARRQAPGADRAGRGPAGAPRRGGGGPRPRRGACARPPCGGAPPRRACGPRRPRARARRAASRSARRFVLLGVTAILLLADAGVGEGVGAGIALRSDSVRSTTPVGRAAGAVAACGCAGAAAPAVGARRRRGAQRPRRHAARPSRPPGRGTALHRLDHDRLRAAMREALAHHVLLDGPLQRQRLGSTTMERLVARGFGIRIAHSAQIPADPLSASGVV